MFRVLGALVFGALSWPGLAAADETVRICHGYSCFSESDIRYTEGQLGEIRRWLAGAADAKKERKALAGVIGVLYRWAGEQSDIHNDRAGNFNDPLQGKMDCIDHSLTTTRLLRLLERRGWLRWHRVREPEERRVLGLFASHWSAVIAEVGDGGADFAVDSWFVDNGDPAVILPLDEWKKGAGPDV